MRSWNRVVDVWHIYHFKQLIDDRNRPINQWNTDCVFTMAQLILAAKCFVRFNIQFLIFMLFALQL